MTELARTNTSKLWAGVVWTDGDGPTDLRVHSEQFMNPELGLGQRFFGRRSRGTKSYIRLRRYSTTHSG